MRRQILIAVNSIYLLFAGLVTGVPIGIGAIVAPIMFNHPGVDRALAGAIMSRAFEGAGILSNIGLSIMLLVAVFEVNYSKRSNTRRLLYIRLSLNIAALLLSVYMSEQLLPMMKQRQAAGDIALFQQLHSSYRHFEWAAILLSVAMIVLTQAILIGPRRDGGHPRQV